MRFVLAASLLTPLSSGARALPPEERAADPRLEGRVTVDSPRVHVGELLRRISEQAGVDIAPAEDGTADEQVSVFLRGVPAAEAVDALCSLFSYRKAEWEWERLPNTGAQPRYRVVRSRAARRLAAALQAEVQRDFEAKARQRIEALKLPQEELERRAQDGDIFLKNLAKDESLRLGLRAFTEQFTPDVQAGILRGERRAQVPLSQLTPSGRGLVEHVVSTLNKAYGAQGAGGTAPVPGSVEFYSKLGVADGLTPSLYIRLGSLGANTYVGGLPFRDELLAKLQSRWLLDGESDHAVSPPPAPTRDPEPDKQVEGTAWEREGLLKVRTSAAEEGVPFIARCPKPASGNAVVAALTVGDAPSPADVPKGISAALADVRQRRMLSHKWHDRVLLLANHSWFQREGEGAAVPWAVLRRLRAAESGDPGGFLGITDVISAAQDLDESQLRTLGPEFPIMYGVAEWRALLVHLARNPDALRAATSRTGSPFLVLPEIVRVKLRASVAASVGERKPVTVRALRVVTKEMKNDQTPDRVFWLEAVGADGSLLWRQGLFQRRHDSLPAPK